MNKQDIDRVLARGRSETCRLDSDIHIKEGARVILTTNINIQGRLINGQMGTVIKIQNWYYSQTTRSVPILSS